ncbi:MAG: MFS transporter [Fibrobacteraceae bacterium]|nr:MFS transporter [Fibrobacteraceae bacterium]
MNTSAVQNYSKASFKAAVLSLSLLTIMSGAGVAPGIHKIAEAFPETPTTLIKLIVALPPLMMIPAALLSGILGQRLRQRKALILCGLVLFVLGGVGAAAMPTFGGILCFRAILGVGTGIILPFSTGLIVACFQNAERTKMMGYSSAVNCLGAIIGNILAGILAAVNWRFMFHIYWLGVPVFLCVIFLLKPLPEVSSAAVSRRKLPGSVYLYSFLAFLTMAVFFLVIANLSIFVESRGLGSSRTTGFLFALNSLVMLLAGISLQKILRLKKFFLPSILLCLAVGLLDIALSHSLMMMIAGITLAGWGLGLLFPSVLTRISKGIPQELSVKAMSIGMASAWFGQFASPLLSGGLARGIGWKMDSVFLLISAMLMILGGISLAREFRKPNSADKN